MSAREPVSKSTNEPANKSATDTTSRKPVVDKAKLQRRLQEYYQLESLHPTSHRLQLFLDQFLRKADVSPEVDYRAQSSGDH